MERVRIGLISCGSMGSSLAQTCAQLDNAQVTVVCDVVKEKAEKLAAELGAHACFDHHHLLEREDVDAVIVASPGYLHETHVDDVASARKHIFCEKPMSFTVASCDRMIEAAKKNNVKLMIGQVLRYLPIFNKVKEIVSSGLLGEPFSVTIARVGGGWGTWGTPWRAKREQVGGILHEVNVHELDFMRYIMGDAEAVVAFAGNYVQNDIDYEDLIHMLVRFKNSGIGNLVGGQCTNLGGYDGRIFCRKGSMAFDNGQGVLRYKPFDGDEVVLGGDDMKTEPAVKRELREFVESIINDTPVTIPGEDGRKVIEIAQAAYISAEEKREVKLPL